MTENQSSTVFMQNRELSWLRFNDRVLDEAEDPSVPTYEKLKFISIFTSNLQEFFMVRVGSLSDLMLLSTETIDNKTGMTPAQQLDKVFAAVPPLLRKKDLLFDFVIRQMKEQGVNALQYSELTKSQRKAVADYFETSIQPVLSPMIIDPRHPFPFLENGLLYIVLELQLDKDTLSFGLIPVNENLPKYFSLPGDTVDYIMMEDILYHHADELFHMYNVLSKNIISVVRNADLGTLTDMAEEVEDYRLHMQKMLKRRKRLAAVGLVSAAPLKKKLEAFLLEKLSLQPNQIFVSRSPLDMSYVYSLGDLMPTVLQRRLSYPERVPTLSPDLNIRKDLIDQIEQKDVLLSFPYENMETFLELIHQAAVDPRVISIKITIYRLAKNSKLVRYLCMAAENGKEVTALMELRARFDEANNINYSEKLYEAGCNIIYGPEHYKVHSKLCLITYRKQQQFRHITQIGTGNYNESTSRIYCDLSLLTANEEISVDAADFFRNIATVNLDGKYAHLLQSPSTLKSHFLKLFDDQIAKGEEGQILLKMNSLTDKDIIEKISQASQSGVSVTLIIRGICCILPGIPGCTDLVEVYSIVGRFLEHARIYMFGKGSEQQIYITSSDLMTRNTERRVEVAAPIYDERTKEKIRNYVNAQLQDNIKRRRMNSAGEYEKIKNGEPFSAQDYFIEEADKAEQARIADTMSNGEAARSGEKQSIWAKIASLFQRR